MTHLAAHAVIEPHAECERLDSGPVLGDLMAPSPGQVKTIGFLHQDVPRDILASFAQHSFQVLPPTDKSLLSEAFCGLGQSLVLEKAFNITKNVVCALGGALHA